MSLLLPLLPWRTSIEHVGEGKPEFAPWAPLSASAGDYVQTLLYHHYRAHREIDFLFGVSLAIFAIGFLSNLTLLLIILMFEGVRSVSANRYLAALSLSNCLVTAHLLLFNFILEPILGPSSLCDFAVYGGVIFCAASNVSRSAIAIDRYIFISDPLRYYQRIQSTKRSFAIGVIFVAAICSVISPYIFVTRPDNYKNICLPAHPQVYVVSVILLLAVVPGTLLVVIYTQIFYWAFLQMQILRQEAKQFMIQSNFAKSSDASSGRQRKSPHSSVTSRQLRLYTGAAVLLTPNSPFGSTRNSAQSAGEAPEDGTPHFETAVHQIIHILSGLRSGTADIPDSVLSTCVDKGMDARGGVKVAFSFNNSAKLVEESERQVVKDDGSYSVKDKKRDDTLNNGQCCDVGKQMESRADVCGEDLNQSAGKCETNMDKGPSSTLFVRDSNQSARRGNTNLDKAMLRSSLGPRTVSNTSITDESSVPSGQYDSAIDDLYGPWPTCRKTSSKERKGYVPVTAQGKWIEERLKNYDVDVVMQESFDSSANGDNLMCRLLKAELKAAMMIMGLMGSFLICWIPFIVVEIIDVFELGEVTSTERTISILLILTNCSLDPITYAVMNPPFRAVVYKSMSSVGLIGKRYSSRKKGPPQKKLAFKYTLKRKLPSDALHDDGSSASV